MLFPLGNLIGYEIEAADKAAGKIADIYVDDVQWNVRHVAVMDAGGVGTQMASVEPDKLGSVDTEQRKLHVNLPQEQIAGGPDVSLDLPVSRAVSGSSDPHLRSISELQGYQVLASDGGVGTIDDFVVGGDDWKVHFVVVATDGRKVLVGPGLIDKIDFNSKTAHVELDSARFAQNPDFDPSRPIDNVADVKLVGRVGI